jgi:hypothetical protein
MSIATLKRKTQSQYNNNSVNQSAFSLNGTHRSQGYVGQTMLSRSLPRTPMKGNVPKGHGGSNGTFLKKPIIQSAVLSLNDPDVVKTSAINTLGLINTKYAWVKRPDPFSSWKPDANGNINDQQTYITNLGNKTINNDNDCPKDNNRISNYICADPIFRRNNSLYRRAHCQTNKDIQLATNHRVMTQGQYLLQLDKKCDVNTITFVPKNTKGVPFGCGISK